MTASSKGSTTLPVSPTQALDLAQSALTAVKATIKQIDQTKRVIYAQKGLSIVSFGENLTISIHPADTGSTVEVFSESAVKSTLMDWGANEKNVKEFLSSLKSAVSSSQIPDTIKETTYTLQEAPVLNAVPVRETESPILERAEPEHDKNRSRVADQKIKILFLAANPSDTPSLRLDQEIRAIDEALRKAEFRDRFEIEQQWAVRVMDLQGYLLRHRPDIVHFSGHGSNSSELILEDTAGISSPVSTRALSQLFAVFKKDIRCVVLNACYSETQANAIAEQIDCVVGMSQAIGDSASISFAAAFYQALGYGQDVQTAFSLGCIQVDMENLNEQDTPQLVCLRCDPGSLDFV